MRMKTHWNISKQNTLRCCENRGGHTTLVIQWTPRLAPSHLLHSCVAGAEPCIPPSKGMHLYLFSCPHPLSVTNLSCKRGLSSSCESGWRSKAPSKSTSFWVTLNLIIFLALWMYLARLEQQRTFKNPVYLTPWSSHVVLKFSQYPDVKWGSGVFGLVGSLVGNPTIMQSG